MKRARDRDGDREGAPNSVTSFEYLFIVGQLTSIVGSVEICVENHDPVPD